MTSNGKEVKRFDPVGDLIAARAAEIAIETEARELAQAALERPDEYTLTLDRSDCWTVRPVEELERLRAA